ncbi:SusD/RagB family nutrient-binding outer membrane lipoprotein [Chitinophaga silvatica]|uniref:SusD/RagB family nutrient-binding outer membrane lipoprotein n=1 Tax=Chitinophaga silvatica TaxID=2282649 RepID=A0A3E1YA46_9BACT|nr:SusD/RagB family nutrient-binding outer membrane lipoprotein [Chitinophaga silvatica]RFS22580.1 SusD/RagB family nutrient-binding outer membrane lipoprotein [Chitinophaga silvatica]
MKKLFIISIAIFTGLSSCKKLEEINVDPNRVTETHPQLQLTQIEWEAFRYNNGTGPLYAEKKLVQTDGESTEQYYKWDRSSFTPYSRMRDVTKMMEEAKRINSNAYLGIGKFFRAFYFLNLTLTFGDVPYSQALQGETQQTYIPPAYDAQKDVFKGILAELKEANDLLAKENSIIAGDIIYKGDVAKWRKAVNAFRLKVLMLLSKKEADADLNIKAAFAQIVNNEPLFISNDEDAQLVFLDQEGNRYPEFNSSGYGSGMYMDSTFIRRLQDREDPRLFIFCTRTKNAEDAGLAINNFAAYEGGDPAAPYSEVNTKAANGKTSKVNNRYHKDPTTEPMVLIGYSEQQLLIAEGIVRGWVTGDADEYYKKGVKASFKFYETNAKGLGQYVTENIAIAYLDKPINSLATATTTEDKIEKIIMQRYLRTFLQSPWGGFFDQIRTGYPSFRRPANVNIPFRWIYPQAEYNNNTTNVSDAIKRQFGEGNDKISAQPWWLK